MARKAILLVLVVCSLSISACEGGDHPFAAKASLLRFWRRTLPDVRLPAFLLEKASPLNATSVALFSLYLRNHTLSDHIASFCAAADLICTRRAVAQDEKAVAGPSDFQSYHGKEFKQYKADDNTFKNYSDNDNVVKDGFKGYGPDSNAGFQTFKYYAPGSNVVDEGFANYGAGSRAGNSDFTSYSKQTNVPVNHFKNYGNDSNGANQNFQSYADQSNVINNEFSTYGKDAKGIVTGFTSYAESSNVITNDFKGYDKGGNGDRERFTTYADDGKAVRNEFQSYAASGNASSETFTNYASGPDQPQNVFKSYGKDSNSTLLGFTNYGENVPGGLNEFTEYAKDSNDPTVSFGSYAQNSKFKAYAKTGVTFSDYTTTTATSNATGVEPGKFFRENLLVPGKTLPMPDLRDYMPKRSFLPGSLADKLPFSTQNLTELMKTFRIPENSTMSSTMARTLRECERAAVKGEIKKCVTSVEGMAAFAVSVLGSKVEVLTTESTAGSGESVFVGTVSGKDGGKVTRSVSCHQSLFPFLVYYCHSVPMVKVYEAALLSVKEKKKINEGIAICHLDTTQWSAKHAAFVSLGHKPGQIEVCHWIFQNDLGDSRYFIYTMRKGAIARRSRRPKVRGVQLSHNVSDEEDNSAPTGNEPECRNPPTVSVQRTSATKKLSVIRGWTKEDMEKVIDDVEFNGFSVRAAAKKYSIPPTSLHYWLNGLTHTKRRGPPTVLTEEEEEEIVEWCKEMADMGHGLELMQLKANVAQICETRQNPFRDGFPGKSWWARFRKRHPDLAIRTAEGLDRDRALNLHPAIAGRNCGVRAIAKRGSRNVPKVIPKSREWITILCCVNAAGLSIPGFYLFKGKRMIKNYIKNCEPGACMAAHPNAWMTKELFLNWLCHFARSVPGGVSPNNRHLLIFDGHGSHVALQTVEEANKLGIDLITLPAHTSHKLQPLDVSVFSPFKTYFRAERSKWMAENKCADVKRNDIVELASRALKKAQTPSNIIAGFKRTGIWPLNYDALLNDMACSQAFDMQGEEDVDAVTNILSLSQ
ncbi:hypothetical protein KI387_005546 [Taxus chinensis]|uniref:HTH CENPB-type domain-containing protein n=1 Tax=Taxus chinensis TaxID=29808 RepID=A0AA38LHR2_TAXCH|nr:hypothetical protein KI387_005546 [Taxus chinensis]